jgi:hypothetical protein
MIQTKAGAPAAGVAISATPKMKVHIPTITPATPVKRQRPGAPRALPLKNAVTPSARTLNVVEQHERHHRRPGNVNAMIDASFVGVNHFGSTLMFRCAAARSHYGRGSEILLFRREVALHFRVEAIQ